jgi:hypothetical protein
MTDLVQEPPQQQFLRGAVLVVKNQDVGLSLTGEEGIDGLRIRFQTHQNDDESPNNATIRVYNLSNDTVKEVRQEFDTVVLQAGYQNSVVGTIFSGTIKQFKTGKENATDSYLDILAADGDIGYNFGVTNATLPAGHTHLDVIKAAAKAMNLPFDLSAMPDLTGTQAIRPKVLFGMARAALRDVARSTDATWSIQDGRVQLIPLDGFLPGEAVVLNSMTGMVGVPELTDQGVRVRCLLNPKIRVGGLVQLNNRDIAQLVQRDPKDPTRFDAFRGIQILPNLNADGLYRVYVAEHVGDTRGQEWYSDLTCLAVQSNKAPAQ